MSPDNMRRMAKYLPWTTLEEIQVRQALKQAADKIEQLGKEVETLKKRMSRLKCTICDREE